MILIRCRVIASICFIFLSIGLTSCTGNFENQPIKIGESTRKTYEKGSDNHESPIETALEAYQKVLQNQLEFYSVYDGYVYWKEYPLHKDFINNCTESARVEYAVVDMNGDAIPEFILNFKGPDLRTILHYENDIVYGHSFGYRQMMTIKKDGSFSWKGGVGYRGYGKLRFLGKIYEEIYIAVLQNPTSTDVEKYTLNDIEVSLEEFSAFMDNHEEKEDVVWNDLKENM